MERDGEGWRVTFYSLKDFVPLSTRLPTNNEEARASEMKIFKLPKVQTQRKKSFFYPHSVHNKGTGIEGSSERLSEGNQNENEKSTVCIGTSTHFFKHKCTIRRQHSNCSLTLLIMNIFLSTSIVASCLIARIGNFLLFCLIYDINFAFFALFLPLLFHTTKRYGKR